MTTAHDIDGPQVLAGRLTTAHPDVLREGVVDVHPHVAGRGGRCAVRDGLRSAAIWATMAALLIETDPTSRAKVIFHNVTELSREESDRYSEPYKTLPHSGGEPVQYFEEALV